MNGCLSKILLIIIILVAIFLSYPYFIRYTSDSIQSKIGGLETSGTIFKKMIQHLHQIKN